MTELRPHREEIIHRFYRALYVDDLVTAIRILHPRFRLELVSGLPHGIGGTHIGPVAAFRNGWKVALRHFGVRAVAGEVFPITDNRVLVLGSYQGRVPDTGKEIDSPFAHILEFDEDQISALRQLTDSAAWVAAARQ